MLDSIEYTFYCFILFLLLASATPVLVPNAELSAFVLLLTAWIVWRKVHKTQLQQASKVWFQEMTVSCPCCDESFLLNATNELSAASADLASQDWVQTNTRPCPRCAARITKNGGCNVMRCPQCRAQFCWACMGVGACGHFRCHNRAPFGNARPFVNQQVPVIRTDLTTA